MIITIAVKFLHFVLEVMFLETLGGPPLKHLELFLRITIRSNLFKNAVSTLVWLLFTRVHIVNTFTSLTVNAATPNKPTVAHLFFSHHARVVAMTATQQLATVYRVFSIFLAHPTRRPGDANSQIGSTIVRRRLHVHQFTGFNLNLSVWFSLEFVFPPRVHNLYSILVFFL